MDCVPIFLCFISTTGIARGRHWWDEPHHFKNWKICYLLSQSVRSILTPIWSLSVYPVYYSGCMNIILTHKHPFLVWIYYMINAPGSMNNPWDGNFPIIKSHESWLSGSASTSAFHYVPLFAFFTCPNLSQDEENLYSIYILLPFGKNDVNWKKCCILCTKRSI